MNDTLSNQLASALEKINANAAEQIPIVTQQLIQYGRISSILVVIIALTVACICIYLLCKTHKFKWSEELVSDGCMPMLIVYYTVLTVILIVSIAHIVSACVDLVKLHLAPNVYILEKAAEFIR